MSTFASSDTYAALLAKFPPRVIRTEEQNESYIATLYELDQRRDAWSPEEAELADLLTLLIEDYEERHYQLPRSSPLERLEYLMEQQGMKQKDLVDVFGTPSIVSEVLNGKRQLNKDHIQKLSRRFNVSPELFF